jgi:hypothetical protein
MTMPRAASRLLHWSGDIDRRTLLPLLGTGAAFLMMAGKAQQVLLPKTAAEVPGPASGTADEVIE